jgi:sterol desaturase/sphingolipid hydroxylase (fatty acid hydroxylase superfamily)
LDFSSGIAFFFGQLGKLLFSLGSHFSLTSLIAALVISALFFAWQRHKRGGRIRWRTIARALFPRRILAHRSNQADIFYLFFNVFMFSVVFGWAILSYQFVSNGIIAGLFALFGAVTPSTLPAYVTRAAITVMLFLAYELGYWFNHWLNHKVPFLWEFHKVHHTAEVLTPLTNFRVHPVYTWIFANILAFSAAVANGLGHYMFGETAYQYALSDTNIILVLFIHAYVHLQHSHMWISFQGVLGRIILVTGASSGASLGRPEILQEEFRLMPRAVGLDVRHALHPGEGARAAQVRLPESRERTRRQGRTGRARAQCRRPSQNAVAGPAWRACAHADRRAQAGLILRCLVPERFDLAQPLLARFVADPHDHAVNGRAHRRNAGEMQDVALEQFERVRAEVPAVEPAGHAHGHDDARRFSFQDAPARPVVAALDRQQIGLQHALDEAFQDRRHVAAPKRKHKY